MPCCGSCGWNVERARRQLFAEIRQRTVIAALMAVYAWAVTGMRQSIPVIGIWALVVMGLPIITRLRRLPPSRPVSPLQPLGGITDFHAVTLEIMTPRPNIILEGLIVVISAITVLFLPRELDPARRTLPIVRHELLFVILTTAFATYLLVNHSVSFLRLVRSIWLERHLAKRAMTAEGRIIGRSDSRRIRYEFLDCASRLVRGAGCDYTGKLYEDMPLSVIYDPDDPLLNMPVAGLQFHRQHGASEYQSVAG
jgi:hypothetical protein